MAKGGASSRIVARDAHAPLLAAQVSPSEAVRPEKS